MRGIALEHRGLYGHILGIDPERVLEIRRWVFGNSVEADIRIQGMTEQERESLSLRLPTGWRVVEKYPA